MDDNASLILLCALILRPQLNKYCFTKYTLYVTRAHYENFKKQPLILEIEIQTHLKHKKIMKIGNNIQIRI